MRISTAVCLTVGLLVWGSSAGAVERADFDKAIAAIEALKGHWTTGTTTSGVMSLRIELSNSAADDDTASTIAALPEVQFVDLSGTKVTDRGVAQLAKLTRLRALSLARTEVTDAGLESLKPLKEVQTLVLNKTEVTDAGLKHLSGWSHLEKLHLYGAKITAQGLTALRESKSLRVMTIAETPISVREFVRNGPRVLAYLYVGDAQNDEAHRTNFFKRTADRPSEYEEFSAEIRVCTSDEVPSPDEDVQAILETSGCLVEKEGGDLGAYIVALQVLQRYDPSILERQIGNLTEVRRLVLHEQELSASFFDHPFANKLITIKLVKCKFTQGALHRAKSLGNLETLEFAETTAPDAMIEQLRDSPLQRLVLDDVDLSDVSYRFLGRHVSDTLRHFELKYGSLSDAGAKNLRRCRELRVVILSDTLIGQVAVRVLAELPLLETLNLDFTPVTSRLLEPLAKHGQLADLSLSNTLVADEGLAVLASLPNLRRLSLAHTRVTDAGLRKLDGCTKLEWIDLRGTDVTPVGTARLEARMPNLEIIE